MHITRPFATHLKSWNSLKIPHRVRFSLAKCNFFGKHFIWIVYLLYSPINLPLNSRPPFPGQLSLLQRGMQNLGKACILVWKCFQKSYIAIIVFSSVILYCHLVVSLIKAFYCSYKPLRFTSYLNSPVHLFLRNLIVVHNTFWNKFSYGWVYHCGFDLRIGSPDELRYRAPYVANKFSYGFTNDR